MSGQLPFVEGNLSIVGRVPDEVSVEAAAGGARIAALNALAVLAGQLADGLVDVRQILRIGVFVQCESGFGDQPIVANGASELLVEVFGEQGRHARAAVGSIGLPLNSTVEVEMLARVR